ncbi:hypothetical protein BCR33DRAFT_779878 [Rhizoclosmatium globosum]|uniref:G-protein coupled receptors family 1 profile domain-containing protein n=1 Tax=Rhizoclosmatium globosum TaxID=329046 RepID=A0A1Y2D090_9FUNG|nr:hypothetical protein BCR33DRAFT_779878 [Rhizoclosmatium globosum]|eukprot:ORY52617.1 hypothetical protein BCR33DRAFT_779878 [Rhizoclosmatium globosum]
MTIPYKTVQAFIATNLVLQSINTLLNGFLFLVMIRSKQSLQTRMDRIVATTLATHCAYSFFQLLFDIKILVGYRGFPYIVLGLIYTFNSWFVFSLFGLNLALGLDRLWSVKYSELSERQTQKYFLVIALACVAVATIDAPIHLSPSTQVEDYSYLWAVGTSIFTWGVVLSIVWVYSSTYLYVRTRLEASTGIPDVHIKLRRVFFSCFMYTAVFLLCYFPTLITRSVLFLRNESAYEKTWYYYTLPLLVSFDSTATPLMIIYFRQDIRQECIKNFWQMEHDVITEDKENGAKYFNPDGSIVP